MILTLMYHHVYDPKAGLHVADFAKHLEKLASSFKIVVPGDTAPLNKLNICLTFDDAFYDFYYFVFPLLKKLHLKAMLAIPTAFIEEDTTLSTEERLNVKGYDGLHLGKSFSHNPFCTWREIKEMVQSGHVIVASHSHDHNDFSKVDVDIEHEIAASKHLIHQHTDVMTTLFVYPYGHLSHASQKRVKKHFRYVMRVGHALNMNWSGLIYRVDAQKYWSQGKVFPKKLLPYWFIKMVFNRVRKR